jgi:AsmA protein
MSKPLQIILGLIGLVILLVLAAVIVIPMVVDPNDYRDEIARAVEEETGRSFEIEGEISLSVFPWLGLEVGRMRLGNPPGFGEEPFAEIASAGVGAKLLPLLSKRLEVSTLRLEGLRLNLLRLADGSTNWDDLGDRPERPERAPGVERETTMQLERIGGLRVGDARIRLEDREAGSILEASIPRLETGELAPGKPFDVEAEATVDLDGGKTRLDTRLGAKVLFAEDFSTVTLRELVLDADSAGEAVAGGKASVGLRGERLELDLGEMTGTLAALSLRGEAAGDAGKQTFRGQAPMVRFALEGPSAEIEDLDLGFEASGPEIPGGTQSGKLVAPRVSLDLDRQTLSVPALTGEVAGLRLSAEVSGTGIVDAPAFNGSFGIEEFSPREFLQRLGEPAPDAADPTALTRAALEAQFGAGTDRLDLRDLQLRLDDTTLRGTAGFRFGEPTRVRAQLELDAIDLDRYLPPEREGEAEPAPSEDTPLAFDWLEGLDLDAALKFGSLRLNGLSMTGVDARAVAKDGVLTLQPLTAALYGGQLRGTARLDARRTPATFSLEQSLSTLQLLPFARDLAEFERLTGVAQLDAKLSTTASSTAGLMSGLNGELSFDIADGAYLGVNLWYEIQRAWAVVRGQPVPARSSPDTAFRQLKGTAVIRDGVLRNEDLVGGLQFLGLAGQGEVNLAESVLDYRLTATVIRQAIDEATGEVSELAGASVPLRLSGSLDSPSVNVDVAGLVRERAGREVLRKLGVEEEDATPEEALKDKAREKLRDRLKGVLGGDD